MVVVPRLCTPIDENAPEEWPLATVDGKRPDLPAPVVGSPVPAIKVSAAAAVSADIPCFWRGLEVPAPMSALAQGTQPESEPEEVPVFWRADAELEAKPEPESEPQSHQIVQAAPAAPHFDEAEHAFFAEGDELADRDQKLDEFLDLADKKLSFWQRLWRR